MQQTGMKEQQPEEFQQRGSVVTSLSINSATSKMTAAMRKREEEKFLFQSLLVPNPYNLVAR